MNSTTLKIILPLIVFFTFGCSKADSSPKEQPAQKQAEQVCQSGDCSDEKPDKVAVYYFHGERRCRTCLGIQSAVEQTINERFGKEAASGKLVYQDVNIEKEANKHFIKEFEISFSTMVVAAMKGDKVIKWVNCSNLWDMSHETPEMMDYVEKKIRPYLDMLKGR